MAVRRLAQVTNRFRLCALPPTGPPARAASSRFPPRFTLPTSSAPGSAFDGGTRSASARSPAERQLRHPGSGCGKLLKEFHGRPIRAVPPVRTSLPRETSAKAPIRGASGGQQMSDLWKADSPVRKFSSTSTAHWTERAEGGPDFRIRTLLGGFNNKCLLRRIKFAREAIYAAGSVACAKFRNLRRMVM